jgi:hypothetical protein
MVANARKAFPEHPIPLHSPFLGFARQSMRVGPEVHDGDDVIKGGGRECQGRACVCELEGETKVFSNAKKEARNRIFLLLGRNFKTRNCRGEEGEAAQVGGGGRVVVLEKKSGPCCCA